MVETIGGTLMLLGGASMSAFSLTVMRAKPLNSIDRARDLLGDGAAPVPLDRPADILALLAQLP